MGSGKSNAYSVTKSPKNCRCSQKVLRHKTLQYAEKMQKELKNRTDLNSKQRLSMNTVCVAFDAHTGRYFYGRNQGIWQDNPPRNKLLFGKESKPGILPKESLEKHPVSNCAEIDAVNHALNAGAKLENLTIYVLDVRKKTYGHKKESCKNCTLVLQGRVRKNYTGWAKSEGDKNEP